MVASSVRGTTPVTLIRSDSACARRFSGPTRLFHLNPETIIKKQLFVVRKRPLPRALILVVHLDFNWCAMQIGACVPARPTAAVGHGIYGPMVAGSRSRRF